MLTLPTYFRIFQLQISKKLALFGFFPYKNRWLLCQTRSDHRTRSTSMAAKGGFTIRKGRPADAKAILTLIKDLCVYEKEPISQVITTEKDLLEDGLAGNDYFHCLVAETNPSALDEDKAEDSERVHEIVGYALYYFGYSTWKGRILYLEDLFVKPELRGSGIGTGILKNLGQICLERNCARMMWVCLHWNTPAKEFYSKIGADQQDQWTMYYFRNEKIEKFSQT